MRYYWKVFLWEKGGKSAEYTKFCAMPIFYEDNLDETLDTGEIVLELMPIETKNAFPPKTKFRLERYVTKKFADEPKTYDLIVDHDDVEVFVGVNKYCTHRISLIEASAIAQGIHIDNIALTYELQDVNLNYKTTQTSEDEAISSVSPTQPEGGTGIRQSDSFEYPLSSGGLVIL